MRLWVFSLVNMLVFVIGETANQEGLPLCPLLGQAALCEALMTSDSVRPDLSSKATKLPLPLKSWADRLAICNRKSYTTKSKSVLFSFYRLVFNKISPKSYSDSYNSLALASGH